MAVMTEEGLLDSYLRRYEKSPDFVAEGMAIRVVEEALSIMEARGMSRADLARAMGVRPAYVSRILKAPPNMTLETIARLAIALGTRPLVLLDAACEPSADAAAGAATEPHSMDDGGEHRGTARA